MPYMAVCAARPNPGERETVAGDRLFRQASFVSRVIDTFLAERLGILRKERKLTQRQVAEETRIPYESYTAYERGEQRAPFWRVATLAQFFDVSMSYLAGMTDDRGPR